MDLSSLIEKQAALAEKLATEAIGLAKHPHHCKETTTAAAIATDKLMTLLNYQSAHKEPNT